MQIEALEPRRLLAFGDLDPTFGTGGAVIVNPGEPSHRDSVSPERVTLLADGRIALATDDAIVLRKANGSIDNSFDFDGVKGFGAYTVRGVKQALDGRLIVAAERRLDGTDESVFFRVDLAGRIDRSFGQSGTATAIAFNNAQYTRTLTTWDVNSGGEIVFIARTTEGLSEVDQGPAEVFEQIGKLTSAGVLDDNFASGAGITRDENADLAYLHSFVTQPPRTGNGHRTVHRVDAIEIDASSNIRLVGTFSWAFVRPPAFDHSGARATFAPVDQYVTVAGLTSQGTRATAFGTNGNVHVALSRIDAPERASEVDTVAALRADGRLLIGVAGDFSGKARILEVDPGGAARLSPLSNGLTTGPSQIEWLPDGRAVLLGEGQGFPFAASDFVIIGRDGSGDWLASSPMIHPETPGISSGGVFAVRATAEGKLLFAGAWRKFAPNSTSFDDALFIQFIRLDPGQLNAPRPDVFANGRDNDIAFDSKGNLHAVYYDVRARRLLYKMRDSKGRWGPAYEIDRGPTVGLLPDVEIDGKNLPSVAYYDGNSADLKFASRDKKFRWTVRTVDSKKAVGQEPALRIPPSGLAAIAYYARTAGDLRLAQLDRAGNWVIQTVDSEGDTGQFPSLKSNEHELVGDGQWVIASARADGAVRLAEQNAAGNWTLSTAAVASGRASHMQFLPGSLNEIAFFDDGPDDLLLARRDSNTDIWSTRTLSSRGNTGRHVTAFERNPGPELFWWDASRNIVTGGRIAIDSATFPSGVLTSIFGAGDQLSFAYHAFNDRLAFIALDSAGNLIVTDG